MQKNIRPSGPSAMEEKKKRFLARWIPYGVSVFVKAESFGIDWENMSLEQMEAAIVFAEEFAAPERIKR